MRRFYRLALTAALFMLTAHAYAYDVCVDGIYYDLNGNEAIVTNNAVAKCYAGKVIIPSEIQCGTTRYAVTAIAPSAFEGCTQLTDVTIPASVKTVGENAFRHCPLLPVHDMLYYADTYLVGPYECSVTGTYKIKEGTRWIANRAFNENMCIRSIIIPASVESIGKEAFRCCDFLKSVTLNGNLEIGQDAFNGTTTINEVKVDSEKTPTIINEDGAFDEQVYNTAQIHVTSGSKDNYKNTYGWRKFAFLSEDLPLAGIKSVLVPNAVGKCYDLEGRSVTTPAKGSIYIKDGRKFLK